ncbi:MAG: HigA family addiction module antitoxin [Armatimonadetes bacterium]|nr:HigA family addiction module antitoxin [Armatimonadota bacterium]
MEQLENIHPGEILQEEFLSPLGLTSYRLAKSIGVQQTRIEQILDGKRSITVDTALRLGRYFQVTPQFWLNLQQMYDIEEVQNNIMRRMVYERIRPYDAQPQNKEHASNP